MARSARTLGLLCCLSAQLYAFDNNPWLEEFFAPEFDLHATAVVAERINNGITTVHEHLQAYQLGADMVVRFLPAWDATLGLNLVRPSPHGAGYENAFLQARYLLLDDLVGDPMSLVLGLRFNVPGAWTRTQRILLYHAAFETQFLVEAGKMFFQSSFWTSRIWGQVNLGQGTQGAPFLDAQLWLEHQWIWGPHCRVPFPNRSEIGLVLDYWAGFGSHRLHLHGPFHGYGHIDYRAAQAGARYRYTFDYTRQTLDLTYRYRFYARSFPGHAHIGDLAWLFHF